MGYLWHCDIALCCTGKSINWTVYRTAASVDEVFKKNQCFWLKRRFFLLNFLIFRCCLYLSFFYNATLLLNVLYALQKRKKGLCYHCRKSKRKKHRQNRLTKYNVLEKMNKGYRNTCLLLSPEILGITVVYVKYLLCWKSLFLNFWTLSQQHVRKRKRKGALIIKKTTFSSHIRKFRWDRVQSHIWGRAS